MHARRPTRPSYAGLVGLVGAAVLAAALGACSDDAEEPLADGKLRVVTTVAPITSIVANIAGPDVQVTGIVPEGTDSHTFEPAPSAAKALATADVVFANGLQLEEPTRELAEDTVRDGVDVVALGDEVLPEDEWIYDRSFPEDGGKPNPHLWTNPPMALDYATEVADRLSELDPDNEAAYRKNLKAFAAKVDALDEALRAATESVPEDQRRLLTYHDAFAYFAEEYGWEVVGAIQPADFGDPTAKEVEALIEQVEEEELPAIFGSEVYPSDVLEAIGKETGATYVDVLRDDDLPGEPGDPGHSWLGLLQFDYVTIVAALGGNPTLLQELDNGDVVLDGATYPQ